MTRQELAVRGEVEDAPWLWLHLVPGVGLANQRMEQGTDVSIRLQYLKKKKKKSHHHQAMGQDHGKHRNYIGLFCIYLYVSIVLF